MVNQQIQTEFQQILEEYGMEAMVYAFRFEQKITELEARLHSSEDPEEILKVIWKLKHGIQYYGMTERLAE